jgi:adenosylcobinamide-GDP ribazoletransferase
MNEVFLDIAAAFQFLTRVPLDWLNYKPDALSRSAKFFPLVGLVIGLGDAEVYRLLSPHLPFAIVALLIVFFSTLVTGGLHEDGLADAADAFGGGWSKQQVIEIMKDSRIGTYGALALAFSLAARVLLLVYLPAARFLRYLISAQIICRWVMLPLGAALSNAGESAGQGGRLAGKISVTSLAVGTLTSWCVVSYLLRIQIVWPVVAALSVALLTGLYYKHRIGGVTGDCFGATSELTLIAVYICGVWRG